MTVSPLQPRRRRAAGALRVASETAPASLEHVVTRTLPWHKAILSLAEKHPTPFYALDPLGFKEALAAYQNAFHRALPRHSPFYAVKSNNHPAVVKLAAASGFGLDVSSQAELELALSCGCERIIFTGPGKSDTALELAAANAARVIVNLDSFSELQRLDAITRRMQSFVRAAIRIFTPELGSWTKFGIALGDLPRFMRQAAKCPWVRLCGIHFHQSGHGDTRIHASVLKAIGHVLQSKLSDAERESLQFVDFGGGLKPLHLEGVYTSQPLGEDTIKVKGRGRKHRLSPPGAYRLKEAISLDGYADGISSAVNEHLADAKRFTFFSEPGRIVSSYSMHILLRVVDKKGPDLVIVDGGINMVGWERYLYNYSPIINLSRFSLEEKPVVICGSLCDPEDIWGFSCYGSDIQEGDVLMVPFQGAYGYSLAQNFIQAIPPVHELIRDGAAGSDVSTDQAPASAAGISIESEEAAQPLPIHVNTPRVIKKRKG